MPVHEVDQGAAGQVAQVVAGQEEVQVGAMVGAEAEVKDPKAELKTARFPSSSGRKEADQEGLVDEAGLEAEDMAVSIWIP